MKMKNTLMSSVLLASVAAFPAVAQQATTETDTDIVSPTEEGATNGSAMDTTGGTAGGATGGTQDDPTRNTPILPQAEQPTQVSPESTTPGAASPGTNSPDPAPGDPTGGTGGAGTLPDPGPDAASDAEPGAEPGTAPDAAQGAPDANAPAATTDPVPQAPAADLGGPTGAAGVTPPDGFEPFDDPRTLTAETLTGQTVYGANDENISSISDLVLEADGSITAVILNVGGFLGFGARDVAVPFEELQIFRSGQDDLRVYLPWTEEQLEAQPEYTPEAEGGTGEYGADGPVPVDGTLGDGGADGLGGGTGATGGETAPAANQ
ncbi:PRC-barrel domain-containing protein [Plastorhodobacter daqingensis]|uniref:PRC-barrel domain-containing protein n=1 Tax=Plastorhodobacter daqingensis TaxID=1387281 RepID=A0ABW2UJ52_9RHOB